MERDGFDAGEVRRLRAEKQHHLGRKGSMKGLNETFYYLHYLMYLTNLNQIITIIQIIAYVSNNANNDK